MRQMANRWVRTLPVFILLAFVVAAIAYSESLKQRAEVGKPAPDFTLEDLRGNPVSLSDFEGRVAFINFWTTWCDACREETPALQAFHERYGDKVVQLGINLREPVDTIEAFMDEFGATYRVLRDTNANVSELYRLKAVPESWFIDRDGVARVYRIGALTFEQMQDAYRATTGEPIDGARVPGRAGSPYTLVADATRPDRIYLRSRDRWLMSEDGGRTWGAASMEAVPEEVRAGATAQRSVVVDPRDPTHLWAGTMEGVLESRDAGKSWQATAIKRSIFGVAVSVEHPGRLYLATGHGIWVSEDRGMSAEWLKGSPARRFDHVIALADVDGETLWAVASNGDVYKSRNAGLTWHLLNGSGSQS